MIRVTPVKLASLRVTSVKASPVTVTPVKLASLIRVTSVKASPVTVTPVRYAPGDVLAANLAKYAIDSLVKLALTPEPPAPPKMLSKARYLAGARRRVEAEEKRAKLKQSAVKGAQTKRIKSFIEDNYS